MKKKLRLYMVCAMLALVFLLGGKKAYAQEVPINAETFPSDWLRNLMLTPKYDLDGNGILSDEEIKKITSIEYVFSADAGRFDLFKAEGLVNLPYCTYLELSNLMCRSCEITFYNDLPSAVQFWYCQIGSICIGGQNVTAIRYDDRGENFGHGTPAGDDWIGVPASAASIRSSIGYILTKDCPNLQKLILGGASARTLGRLGLDVTKNKKLRYLYCNEGNLKELDLRNNKELEYLWCRGNTLKGFDLSAKKKLKTLDCADCSLEMLDVSNSPELLSLDCSGNSLKSLNLQKNKKLKELNCYGNRLKSLNLQKNKQLGDLQCYRNNLKSLDLRKNVKLTWLMCDDNQINTLRLPNTFLVRGRGYAGYRCDYEDEINYDDEGEITYSSFSDNPIQTLDITSVKKFGDDMNITVKDLSKFMSGVYHKKEFKVYKAGQGWIKKFRGKSRPIKKLIVNKKLKKKDMEKVRKQARKYKVKLVYR